MPDELENRVESLENRVSGLEQRLHVSEQDAAAARVLAGGADRDVAEIRAEIREARDQNTRLHNATRQDIADLRARLDQVDARFADVDRGFAEMRGRFDAAAVGQQQLADMLTTLIERDDRSN